MTIFVYKGLTWNSEIGIAPFDFSPISGDWSKLGIPNLAQMTYVFRKKLLNAAKYHDYY